MNSSIDFTALQQQLEEFRISVPEILKRSQLTHELAKDIEATLSVTESQFTLAVAGQMKVGKSTLINAMIGADLAIPGVNETTATVNWFLHGSEEKAKYFRAYWNDAQNSSEDFALTEKDQWLGNSERAAKTRFLEFYSPAEFLRKVRVVDTPGTGSTIESHSEASKGFLLSPGKGAGKAERDSLFFGGLADCICYVLPSVIRLNDNQFLGKFASETRLPQSSPYNSVGLLHTWEKIEDPAPWKVAIRQADTAFRALHTYVCKVIPVSGPLARACQKCPALFWDDVIECIRGTAEDSFEVMFDEESFYADSIDCSFTPRQRRQLFLDSGLPWRCFYVTLLYAKTNGVSSGEELQKAIRKLSGIDELLEFLERRFFDRSRLIHASTLLSRALRITELARGRIRDRLSDVGVNQTIARQALGEIGSNDKMPKAKALIERNLTTLTKEAEQLTLIQRDLEAHTASIRRSFESFELDCRALQMIDNNPELFDRAETLEIMRLLGAYGTSVAERLGAKVSDKLGEMLQDRFEYWFIRRGKETGDRRFVIDQIVTRIESVLADVVASQS